MSVRSRVKVLEHEVSVLGFTIEYLLRRGPSRVDRTLKAFSSDLVDPEASAWVWGYTGPVDTIALMEAFEAGMESEK